MDADRHRNDPSGVSAVLTAMGKRLKQLRLEAGKSQEELGQAANVSAKYVSQLENGHANPSLEVLHALAEKGLRMPLAAFFAYDTHGRTARDELREIQLLLAAVPKKQRARALHVLRALVEPLGTK